MVFGREYQILSANIFELDLYNAHLISKRTEDL